MKIQSVVKPSELKVTIKNVHQTKTGAMVIQIQNNDVVEKIIAEPSKNETIKANFEFAKPKERNPHIILYVAGENIERKELITENNDVIEKNSFTIKAGFKSLNGKNWTNEVRRRFKPICVFN